MNRTELLQKIRTMQFEQIYRRWKNKELREADAAEILNMSERTFRRYVVRYENEGTEGLLYKRIERSSPRRASVEEVETVERLYQERYMGRNVVHFYEAYTQLHRGRRSCNWVKNCLHRAGLVAPSRRRGPHRQLRERKPRAGMMLHQDAGTHQWVLGKVWDLVVTMDDATGELSAEVNKAKADNSFVNKPDIIARAGVLSARTLGDGNTQAAGAGRRRGHGTGPDTAMTGVFRRGSGVQR